MSYSKGSDLSTASPAELRDSDWTCLEAELARVDLLLRRKIRCWALANQDPNDDYRGLYVTQAEAGLLLACPPGTNWGDTVELPADEDAHFQAAMKRTIQDIESLRQQWSQAGHRPRLYALEDAFHLDQVDREIVLLCLAPALDTRYERLYGFLQDNVTLRRPAVNLALNLLGPPGLRKLALAAHFHPDSPLMRYGLIEQVDEPGAAPSHLINRTLHVHPTVVSWLLGQYLPHPALKGQVALQQPGYTANDAAYTADIWPEVVGAIGGQTGARDLPDGPPLVMLWGPDEARRDGIARRLAAQWQVPLLCVNLDRIVAEECPPLRAVHLALRDARLTGAALYLRGWDVCLTTEDMADGDVLAEVCAHQGMVIIAGHRQWQASATGRRRRIFVLEVPMPGYLQRIDIWSHLLAQPTGGHNSVAPHNEFDLDSLAAQFALSSTQIQDAVVAALDLAEQGGRRVENRDLYTMARAVSNPRLGLLARKITPRYDWDDLILPADQVAILQELVATVRGRVTVLDAWGVGQKLASSAGVTALFAGPPGTGKTMAAEVIAHTLGLDLYKIELSSLVSKYIGETEKNLERIFKEAVSSNSILFFDEADAIFGKRSEVRDAHDRYANIEVSYLLQRMEAYDGVTILATNLRANLDNAFARRLHFAVDFPFPGPGERLHIWNGLFPPGVPRAPALDLGLLARRFELSGGSIRNIIVGAAYLAASDGGEVTMAHLMHSTRRELQKMGRLVDQAEFGFTVER